jgi:hypothetical protein
MFLLAFAAGFGTAVAVRPEIRVSGYLKPFDQRRPPAALWIASD